MKLWICIMASKQIVVRLTCGIEDFLSEKGAKRRSHCVKCISRIRRALQKCNVIRYFLLIAYQNSSGLFTHSPVLNLNMFVKAHIVFRSQMIIDTMIVNRLKHIEFSTGHVSSTKYCPCFNNQWKYWPTKMSYYYGMPLGPSWFV